MLLNLRNACLDLGGPKILDNVVYQLEKNQRVALLGRNGCGKSTLLKVLAGNLQLDSGMRELGKEVTIDFLPQVVPDDIPATVYDLIAKSLKTNIHDNEGWDVRHRIDKVLSQFELSGDEKILSMSGGRQRRALLASVVVNEPDILLLDEPTNHLDVESVLWLENYLFARRGALLFVSHDREFISKLATRIIELDRGHLHQYDVMYKKYLQQREKREEEEQRHAALFDKKLAEEERWIRQGVQARRTRNEGRVRALKALRVERQARRDKQSVAQLRLDSGQQSGKVVAEAQNISFNYQDKKIVADFSATVLRGDKVGLIGPNGVGKTTLLKLLLGELTPASGRMKLGTKLEVAYLDQQRSEIDPEKSLIDNVSVGREFIEIEGQSQHIISYLQRFLFDPQQARARAGLLSGGERARLLLARLFSQPANVLVLDEPTNDLDIESLELLESLLVAYQGTLFLVSHDRALLDNVVTSSFAFEGDGCVGEYVGGYSDYLKQRQPKQNVKDSARKTLDKAVASASKKTKPAKLSYKDQRELEALPDDIAELESEQESLYSELANPELHIKAPNRVREAKQQLEDIDSKLNYAYARWEELEALKH